MSADQVDSDEFTTVIYKRKAIHGTLVEQL
jgi:hypothetical protein